MKILHLITSLKIGGAESALYNFLEQAANGQNEHVVIYFHDGQNAKKIAHLGITVIQIQGLISPYDPVGIWRLHNCITQQKPTLIHSALWSANIIGRLLAKLHKIPIICDLHGNSYDEGWLRNFIERKTAHLSSKIIAVSENTRTVYCENIINRITDKAKQKNIMQKVIIVNNGIDFYALLHHATKNKITRNDIGINKSDFIIGAVGRLEPIKSYDVLIKAFAYLVNDEKILNVKLCIIGGGSQENTLKQLTKKLQIDHKTIFLGQQENPYQFYPLFDCFVLSSNSEGMSIALLEALAFGLPIITTNNHPTHDVIQQGIHGFIVPPQQPITLVQRLKFLIENTDAAQKMHLENKALATTNFSLKKTVDTINDLYTTCK
jgi:glycosyltransferase involved in cell wall biosynthesis